MAPIEESNKDLVANHFRKVFSIQPSVFSRAPGRVEVLGNHTDYNEGVVLSAAIDREVWIAAAKSDSGSSAIASRLFSEPVVFDTVEKQKGKSAWANYPMGVYQVLKEKGYPVGPFKMAIHSMVPLGAGVSSSAALEVGVGLAFCALFNLDIDPKELTKICQRAENTFVGANCGLLDQFSSMFGKSGHLLFSDFRSLDHQTIPIAGSDVSLAITLSGVTHSLVAGEYNSRRKECFEVADYFSGKANAKQMLRDVSMQQLVAARGDLNQQAYRRALHVVGEDERVFAGMDLLKNGALDQFGKLLYQSHESSINNFENSCKELDILVDIARSIGGVYGARLTGGGFGGATLTMLMTEARENFEAVIKSEYKKNTGRTAVVHFARIADGACIL